MTLFRINTRDHVLTPVDREYTAYPSANYESTQLGLCGILKRGETLESFKDDYIKRKSN